MSRAGDERTTECPFCTGEACAHCGSSPAGIAWCFHDVNDRHAEEECVG